MLVEKLPVFIQSGDLEVQERACCILQVRGGRGGGEGGERASQEEQNGANLSFVAPSSEEL